MSLISDDADAAFFVKICSRNLMPRSTRTFPFAVLVVVSGKLESWGVNCERRQSPFIIVFPSCAQCRRLQELMKEQEEARHLLAYLEQVAQKLSS